MTSSGSPGALDDDGQLAVSTARGDRPPSPLPTDIDAAAVESKVAQILAACRVDGDREILRSCATSRYGLVSDEVRKQAWPIIVGVEDGDAQRSEHGSSWRDLPPHRDEEQVQLDVNRSFVYYPHDVSEQELQSRRDQLSDLIVQLLREHPLLCYFQGFHDIVQVFLLVLGFERASATIAHVSLLRIRDFMLPSLSPSLAHLRLLPLVLSTVDPQLRDHLSTIRPYFALSSTLTMYAHDIQEYTDIARLFDFFLAQPAVMSIYMFATIILNRKSELLEIPQDEPDVLHVVLSKLPKTLDLEALMSQSLELFERHPPESLPGLEWWSIPRYSVLKDTRYSGDTRTLHDGEQSFQHQVAQLRREERRKQLMASLWRSRRPLGLGLAIVVGVLAIWLQKEQAGGIAGLRTFARLGRDPRI